MSAGQASRRLADHLVSSGLVGVVATSVRSCVDNCRQMVAGHSDFTFGLSDWQTATYDDAVAALRRCGTTLAEAPDATAHVRPEVAMAALERQREKMAGLLASRPRVLIATGHAFALLSHYQSIAAAVREAGGTVLEPLEGRHSQFRSPGGEPCSIRYFNGVASLVLHGSLQHTHRPDYMEAMISEAGGPGAVDAVIGDHGFAGAAIEAGIPTIAIADVNDPALPLAQARSRTDGVVVMDDGLEPAAYEPLTAFLLGGDPSGPKLAG